MKELKKLDQHITNQPEATPASRVVIYDDVAYFTGHSAVRGKDITEQVTMLCKRYDELMSQFDLKKENIVYANAYLKDRNDIPAYEEVLKDWVGVKTPPAGTAVQAPPMGDNNFVELALIVATDKTAQLKKLDQHITNMPEPTPASRVVINGSVAYFTGHSAFKGEDRETLAKQTRALTKRYDELLEQFGLKKERILMYTAYLADIDKIDEFKAEVGCWLSDLEYQPAGVAVQAPPGGDGNLLELSLIVAADDSPIEYFEPNKGYSRAVIHDGLVYFTGHVAKPTAEGYAAQTDIILKRYDSFFEKLGLDRKNIVMANTYVKDIKKYIAEAEPVWKEWVGCETPPAGVAVLAAPEQVENLIEIALIVAK